MAAGELSDHFDVSKPTMSAHFAVLQEAGLIEAEKSGRTIIYRLSMSVLEEALLGFAQTVGWQVKGAQAGAPLRGRGRPCAGAQRRRLTMVTSRMWRDLTPAVLVVGAGLVAGNWYLQPERSDAWALAALAVAVLPPGSPSRRPHA